MPLFDAPDSAAQARAIQEQLRARLVIADQYGPLHSIAGIDVGYDTARGLAHASVVRMTFPGLLVQEQVQAYVPVSFPYIPGLLSFREIPALLAALAKLEHWPGLLMVDGQGIAHPRRMGIAAHLGVLLDMPAIGVAKSRLTGQFEMPGPYPGDHSALVDKGERIGTVLRSKAGCNPLFISPGHRVSLDTSLALTISCLTRYRLPEPTRLADRMSKCTPAAMAEIDA